MNQTTLDSFLRVTTFNFAAASRSRFSHTGERHKKLLLSNITSLRYKSAASSSLWRRRVKAMKLVNSS